MKTTLNRHPGPYPPDPDPHPYTTEIDISAGDQLGANGDTYTAIRLTSNTTTHYLNRDEAVDLAATLVFYASCPPGITPNEKHIAEFAETIRKRAANAFFVSTMLGLKE